MRSWSIIAAALLIGGCSQQVDAPSEPTTVQGPQFPAQSGQPASGAVAVAYPDRAQWGIVATAVVPNWSFIGYADLTNKSLAGVQEVQLAEFYNPHGYDYQGCVAMQDPQSCAAKFPDAVYPAGSPFGEGTPKPRALSLGVAAVWCGPCNEEARDKLPPAYDKYKPLGGQFLQVLVDGPDQGVPATFKDITNWKTAYTVHYSLMTDPGENLETLFEPLLPSNAIVRTSDMKILFTISGAPLTAADCANDPNPTDCNATDNAMYWGRFEQVLKSSADPK